MQIVHSATYRPRSNMTDWLVSMKAAYISEGTVHGEMETGSCITPPSPRSLILFLFYFWGFSGLCRKHDISAMVICLSTLSRRDGKFYKNLLCSEKRLLVWNTNHLLDGGRHVLHGTLSTLSDHYLDRRSLTSREQTVHSQSKAATAVGHWKIRRDRDKIFTHGEALLINTVVFIPSSWRKPQLANFDSSCWEVLSTWSQFGQ